MLRAVSRHAWSWNACLQDGFVGFVLSLLPWPLSALALLVAALDSVLWRSAHCRLGLADFAHFRHARNFTSSLTDIVWAPQALWLAGVLALGRLVPESLDLWGVLGLFGFLKRAEAPNAFVMWAGDALRRARPPSELAPVHWKPRNEQYQLLDPEYPLLRRTTQFLGSKTFEMAVRPGEKPHVICVFLESFRAKDLGESSPCFNRLAQEGVLFRNFHAQGTRTSHGSIASLYGIPPASVPSYLRYYLDIPLRGLPHVMADAGYTPCLIQGGHLTFSETLEFFQTHGFTKLFGKNDVVARFPEIPSMSWGAADAATFRFAAEWLSQQTDPAFLSLFSISNHHPWRLPGDAKSDFRRTFAYTDACLGQFVQQLDEAGLLERSILLVLADHGYGLGERDTAPAIINRHLYQENVHIPLLIYAKGRIGEPKVVDAPASQIDLLPTVLDLLGLQGVHHSLGRSLMREDHAPIFFSNSNVNPLLAWREGNWKYIQHPVTGREELYDLARDPEERVCLAEREGTTVWKEKMSVYGKQLDALYHHKRFCPPAESAQLLPHLDWRHRLDVEPSSFAAAPKGILSLDLRHCLLLTDESVRAALEAFPRLESLNLQGASEVTGEFGTHAPGTLGALNLLSCPQLQATRVAPWIASLPGLAKLQLDVSSFGVGEYERLAEAQSQWEHVELEGASALGDAPLQALFSAQRQLEFIRLEGAPLRSLDVLQGLRLGYLVLENCPFLTDAALGELMGIPLLFLAVRGCPQVEGAIFEKLRPRTFVEWR